MRTLLAWYRAGQVVRFQDHTPRLPHPWRCWVEACYLFFALVIAPAVLGFLVLLLGLGLSIVLVRAMHLFA